jgi:superfamily II DNA/RNA helicase
MDTFSQLGLAEPLAEAFASFGFPAPTPVQAATIPAILQRRDVIVESETGTGKTFAYLAPAFQLVSTLDRPGSGEPLAMIAAPTQELAVQIGREAERLAKAAALPAKTVVLLGGTPLEKQAVKLKTKPEIVVGTLGRLADLVSLGRLKTASLKLLVLDEADRLFAPETEALARSLLERSPAQATRVLASATIPERIRREMRPYLRDALEICPDGAAVLSGDIEHWCFYCDGRKRLDFARRFEAAVRPERCLLFMTMASRVEKAAAALEHYGLPIAAIHSGLDKEARRVALERFASGELRYLLTSDLGARGLDIAGISHVLSLDLPEEPTIYTHRAGRTGRAGAKGVSIVLADRVELSRASKIAVKGGFVFRCKVLEEGKVLEPTKEEFFARASDAEDQKMAAKAERVGDRAAAGERRGGARRRPDGGGRPRPDSGGREGFRARSDRPPRERTSDRALERSSERDPTEGPRTARKPASAPWRPLPEGETRPKGETGNILRKKSQIDEEKRAASEAERQERPPRPPRPQYERPAAPRPRPENKGPRPERPPRTQLERPDTRSPRPDARGTRPERPDARRAARPEGSPRGGERRTTEGRPAKREAWRPSGGPAAPEGRRRSPGTGRPGAGRPGSGRPGSPAARRSPKR